MGTHYTSYCEKCKLAIDDGKDLYRIRHELFKLYHNYRYKDHEVKRYNDDRWVDKWLDDEENEPKELYNETLGYLVSIPQWLQERVEKETELWIKNEYIENERIIYGKESFTEEDVVRKTIELSQDKLLTECLHEFERRLKRVLTINEIYDRSTSRRIELLHDQRLVVLTHHGTFIVDDSIEDVNLFTVKDNKRIWIAKLKDDNILKYGTEADPTNGTVITDIPRIYGIIDHKERIKELVIDGLITEGGHHKQWYLEKVLEEIGYNLEKIREELIKEDYDWDKGIPP